MDQVLAFHLLSADSLKTKLLVFLEWVLWFRLINTHMADAPVE